MSRAVSYESQISRASLYWLLFAQFALVLPHVSGLPAWLFGVCLFCGFWRIQIYRGKFPYASGITRIIMIVGSLTAVVFSYMDQLGLDAAVTFLILIFFLKLLETRRARDMYVTIFLGYFVAATQLLYDQSMLAMAYSVFCYLLLSVSLLALHHRELGSFGTPIVRAGSLLLQGLPVLLVLFLFFPRVDPLWMVPLPNQDKRPGLGDTITLGAFGRLAQTEDVAFRATFDGTVPTMSQRYWRGAVFENFDGRSWQISKESEQFVKKSSWQYERRSGGSSYSVILEPSDQTWLFAMPIAHTSQRGIRGTAAYTLRMTRQQQGRYQYRVQSRAYRDLSPRLDAAERLRNLTLPEQGNEQARQLGESVARSHGSPRKIAAAIMTKFNREAYYYTLNPPVYGRNAIDGFLFSSKQGYCEHYASAFVYLMRAAGVPARLVAGYLGGEVNPFEGYLTVRQMDAHAWAEVWIEGRGWLRFDPTAQVAPERVNQGVETTLRQRNEYVVQGLLGYLGYDDVDWIQGMQSWWDAVNYGWSRWFLNYDRSDQLQWMKSWFGQGEMSVLLQVMSLSLSGVILLLLFWVFRGLLFRKRPPAYMAALWFNWLLGLLGSRRRPSETMISYSNRVAIVHPQLAHTLTDFAAVFSALSYADLQYPWSRRIRLHYLVLVLAGQVCALKMRPQRIVKTS